MKNPFNHENYPSNRIKRNSFPLSFQYNGTFEYGKIYPVGLIRVPNAGTYKIEPTLALNFMPTVFPVQTRQKAYLHFFYGRDRNFWNEYKDYIHGLKPNLVKPYLDESVTQARTGNLLDYLGVPTTIVGKYGVFENVEFNPDGVNGAVKRYVSSSTYLDFTFESLVGKNITDILPTSIEPTEYVTYGSYLLSMPDNLSGLGLNKIRVRVTSIESSLPNNQQIDTYMNSSSNGIIRRNTIRLVVVRDGSIIYDYGPTESSNNGVMDYNITDTLFDDDVLYIILRGISNENTSLSLMGSTVSSGNGNVHYTLPQIVGIHEVSYQSSNWSVDNMGEVVDIDETTSPYWHSGATADLRERIKLNAIPCRMYETIYNLYYRNPQNNPYILNGVPEYNIFTPTLDGGVDNNLYQLRYRNWADDFLTTATQTPQQGIAPLVGLTDRGATITLTNEDGSITRYKTNLDEDGNLTGIETTDSSEPILTQALVDAVTYGISIEDIRNVNKMQKWLELNLRKGYQYKDVIEARWGISISYNELNLPEFIGGFTQEVSMQAVTQTANIDDSVTGQLGWQAGRMYCAKDGREITHYCDEAGYIMVLLSVAPMPNYSQLLPKHWFTRDLLEEYQPEFNHIGFQPITYKEVCPVQAFQESTETNNVLEQTFGYQRPWYEYMSMPDEVHGQFRTTLKDYLINRVFDVKPELSESFLLVDPEQINDVFNVTESDDKILGAINYNIVAKLPISEYATASIE